MIDSLTNPLGLHFVRTPQGDRDGDRPLKPLRKGYFYSSWFMFTEHFQEKKFLAESLRREYFQYLGSYLLNNPKEKYFQCLLGEEFLRNEYFQHLGSYLLNIPEGKYFQYLLGEDFLRREYFQYLGTYLLNNPKGKYFQYILRRELLRRKYFQ